MRIILLFIFVSINLIALAQNTPYLNANRGNYRECIVDKDTNVYLFRFNQLEKYNKHLHPIWVKQYDSLAITNLLLSKTNALFFISGNKIGKMDTAGTIIWCKKLSATANNMMLNHQNHLAIATTEGLFKMDTLGNIIYCKKFIINYWGTSVGNIINDSMGVYEFITSNGMGISNFGVYKFKYSELLDSVISVYIKPTSLPTEVLNNIYISHFFSNTVYSYCRRWLYPGFNGGPTYGILEKYVGDSVVYSMSYNNLSNTYPYNLFNNITEDKYGNAYFTQAFRADEAGLTYGYPRHVDVYKIDSLANSVNVSRFLDDVTTTTPVNIQHEIGTFHHLYNKNFLLTYSGTRGFTADKPLISLIDSTFKSDCSSTGTYSYTKGASHFTDATSSGAISTSTNTAYTCINQSIIATTITTFNPDTNYCLSIGIDELKSATTNFKIYPNPANSMLNVKLEMINEATSIEITNALGQRVFSTNTLTQNVTISINNLLSGMYYLSVKTKDKTVTKKFIKE